MVHWGETNSVLYKVSLTKVPGYSSMPSDLSTLNDSAMIRDIGNVQNIVRKITRAGSLTFSVNNICTKISLYVLG